MRKTLGVCALAASTVLMSVACNDESAGGAAGAKVIVVLPLTGPFQARGESELKALTMAVQDLQGAKVEDALGGPLALLPVDCGPGRDIAKEGVLAEIAGSVKDGKHQIRGIISSTLACLEASLPLAIDYQIPHFEVAAGNLNDEVYEAIYGASHDHSTLDSTWSFSTRGPCITGLADVAAELMAQHTEWNNIAIVRGNKIHDREHTKQVRATMEALGATSRITTTLENEVTLSYDATTFEDSIKALMDSANPPDAIFYHMNGDSYNLRFLGDAKRAGFQGAIVTCGMARSTPLITPAENGNISDYLVGRLFFAMRSPPKSDANTLFKTDFKEFAGQEAVTFTPSTYDAMILLGLGLVQAGDGDNAAVRDAILDVSKEGEPVLYRELAKAMDLIKAGTNINYDGPSGSLDIREDNRTVPSSYYVEEVKADAAAAVGFKYGELSSPARSTR